MKMRIASQLQIQGRGPTPQGTGGNQLRFVDALVDLKGGMLGMPRGSNSFDFMQISEKLAKSYIDAPREELAPPLGNIGSSIVMFLCSYNISSGNQNDLFPPLGLNIAVGFFLIFFWNFCMNCMICLLPPAYVSR